MKNLYLPKIEALPNLLIQPERYKEVQPIAEIATVHTLYPDLPEVYRIYPEQSGEQGA